MNNFMDDFRKWAHLIEQLGEERVRVLISSDNTGRVQVLCDELIASALPTTMTLGGRTYDILYFLQGDEKSVTGDMMVARANEAGAHNGKEEREHLLKYQDEIPPILQGKAVFVFTDDRRPGSPESVYYVYWVGGRWVARWSWLVNVWGGDDRVLRRKSA